MSRAFQFECPGDIAVLREHAYDISPHGDSLVSVRVSNNIHSMLRAAYMCVSKGYLPQYIGGLPEKNVDTIVGFKKPTLVFFVTSD